MKGSVAEVRPVAIAAGGSVPCSPTSCDDTATAVTLVTLALAVPADLANPPFIFVIVQVQRELRWEYLLSEMGIFVI